MNYKKTVAAGIMTAAAAALQVFEETLPVPVPVPGGKLGAANIVTLTVMKLYGAKYAFAVCAVRSVLGCLLRGGISALPYSLGGAVFSCFICAVMMKYFRSFTLTGTGVASALAHNFAQVTAAAVILQNAGVFSYYPILMLISVPCGIFTGLASGYIIRNIEYKEGDYFE